MHELVIQSAPPMSIPIESSLLGIDSYKASLVEPRKLVRKHLYGLLTVAAV